ncbi:Acetolactate synthase isozyme II large subunit [Proteus mirabilis]|uniref:Acetolactate synthase isozyme II large subunit n=1 Tax=Proteus mirabilis TaxID=584 RepID=A0A379FE75_PROMI|nr:Acetolactate synthase isozyme II large subunit [Proteus mirabilis]
MDVLGLSLACTKHSFLVSDVNELPRVVSEAFSIAKQGRPGPVLIDITKDVQLADASHLADYPLPQEQEFPYPEHEIAQALQMLAQAKKPILYVGGGVAMSQGVEALRSFVKQTQIPVVSTLKGLGCANAFDANYLGMLGMHGTKAANYAVQRSDLLIAVGARFDDRVTGRLNTFAPNAKVIHIDIDYAELNKLKQAHIALLGDAKVLLPKLSQPLAIEAWQEEVQQLIAEYAWRYDHPGEAIYAPLLLKQLSDAKPENSIVTTDVGQHQMWSAQHMTLMRQKILLLLVG